MNENKTKPHSSTVEAYLETVSEQRRKEARTLIDIMQKVSGEPPVMWGSMIGFGSYHYKYPSGREADWFLIGFSPRKAKISLYITGDAGTYKEQLDDMGKYSIGKGCIYINKLADVDIDKLQALTQLAYDDGKKRGWAF